MPYPQLKLANNKFGNLNYNIKHNLIMIGTNPCIVRGRVGLLLTGVERGFADVPTLFNNLSNCLWVEHNVKIS